MFNQIKLQKKINSLENEVDTLETIVKDKLYKTFMEKLGESAEVEQLKKENKSLRKKNKLLKEMLQHDYKKKGKKKNGN